MSMRGLVFAVAMIASIAASAQEPVRVFAAGSLRAAMTEMGQAFTASGGATVATTFSASGLLRERIEKGEGADVFASADVGNASTLARANRAAAPVVFARNRLCALLAAWLYRGRAAVSDLDRQSVSARTSIVRSHLTWRGPGRVSLSETSASGPSVSGSAAPSRS